MPGDDRDPFIESRIDAALRSYAEPPLGASDSRTDAAAILERARHAHRRPLWIWMVPAAAALGAVVVLLVWIMRPAPAPRTAILVPPPPAVSVAEVAAPTPTHARVRSVARVVPRARPHTAPLPEQPVFPTPAPLSAQEKALLVFARNAPPAVRLAVIREESRWDQEAKIGAPAIGPLVPSPMQSALKPENQEP